MKICILTQPLGHNYGGLLQAYALQQHIKKSGFEVITINRREPDKNVFKKTKINTLNLLRLLLGKIKSIPTEKRQDLVWQNLYKFRDQYISLSAIFDTEDKLKKHFDENVYDVVIVGSDQVWRPKYSPSLMNYFLDFITVNKADTRTKCISYAASFGVDNWEFTVAETEKCKKHLKKFDAVTVREDSAVNLCKKYLKVDAERVVDPTMLLDASEYESLIDEEPTDAYKGKVLSYVLDPQKDKQLIAKKVANSLNKKSFFIKPEKQLIDVPPNQIKNSQYPKVEQWLCAFKNASYVVTDSFHGCVFAILFNKPFIAVGNSSRGLARFESLLSMFDLKERLVLCASDLTEDKIKAIIDWDKVNLLRKKHSELGKSFLQKYINDSKSSS